MFLWSTSLREKIRRLDGKEESVLAKGKDGWMEVNGETYHFT